ncbi:MAG: hypothetical protein Q9225_005942 [Loekoesia sp. 1 TL-2023]
MTLLSYEMYTHLQSLRALHPAMRSEVTNALLEKLYPWYEKRFFMPGSTVQGCLACALGLLYNDTAAMNALAVLAKSWYKKGVGYAQLVSEGWLGWWAEETKGVREVRRDRNRARRETGVGNNEWDERGKGVDFRPVVWGDKKKQEEVKLMGPPARPDRVKGMTLWGREESKMERMSERRFQEIQQRKEEEKRWSDPTPGRSVKPRIPEKSKLREQVGSPPLSPLSRRPDVPASPKMGGNRRTKPPPMRRTRTDATPRSSTAGMPAPLKVNNQDSANGNHPARARSTKTPTKPNQKNPFDDDANQREWWDDSSSEEEQSIVVPSVINGGDDSDSDYGDDDDHDIRQRYLDEHDELMKLVGAPGWSRLPKTRDYLNTLPPREEESRVGR